ncbi:pyridoxine 5'-phosphate synthase [Actimicrobium antarcticum]|uniref:Pyridoxine 5'-phosphate synthase n=1 Tax=Actimicrobium antarcticum TaxID=1051899 RepID=A0ABP7TAM2_9BURK
MTKLSVNINKIALLRNSRGRNYPDVSAFAERCLSLGADGITLHPRPDQRHARYDDVVALHAVTAAFGRELNVEGFPTSDFMEVVQRVRPAQCTLVPDSPDQLTSDHGWDLIRDADLLRPVIAALKDNGVRVSLFVDVGNQQLALAKQLGADRIELYTEPYAQAFGTPGLKNVLDQFHEAALRANAAGLGVNAGHDLNLDNLPDFLTIPGILEVSIGHALIVECLESGIETVLGRYCASAAGR